MFTIEEIEAIISKMGNGYNSSAQRTATGKLISIKQLMIDSGIKEIKIII